MEGKKEKESSFEQLLSIQEEKEEKESRKKKKHEL